MHVRIFCLNSGRDRRNLEILMAAAYLFEACRLLEGPITLANSGRIAARQRTNASGQQETFPGCLEHLELGHGPRSRDVLSFAIIRCA